MKRVTGIAGLLDDARDPIARPAGSRKRRGIDLPAGGGRCPRASEAA